MMMILPTCIMMVLFKSYSCWILNDINSKIIGEHLHIGAEELREADYLREINFIYPGTLWCGSGNVADNYDDLGTEREADKCCRDHDKCPDIIEGGESMYNLTNNVFYTRLSCECDEAFLSCLKAAEEESSTRAAKVIGSMYFNALHTKCFRKDYPVLQCIRWAGWFRTKCIEYSYDTTKEKYYQWFDVSEY